MTAYIAIGFARSIASFLILLVLPSALLLVVVVVVLDKAMPLLEALMHHRAVPVIIALERMALLLVCQLLPLVILEMVIQTC